MQVLVRPDWKADVSFPVRIRVPVDLASFTSNVGGRDLIVADRNTLIAQGILDWMKSDLRYYSMLNIADHGKEKN